jgi:hypothetical protein
LSIDKLALQLLNFVLSVDELALDLSDLAKQEGYQIVEPIDLHMQVDITILSRFGSGRCLGGRCVVTYMDLTVACRFPESSLKCMISSRNLVYGITNPKLHEVPTSPSPYSTSSGMYVSIRFMKCNASQQFILHVNP